MSEAVAIEQGSRVSNPFGGAPLASNAHAETDRMRAVTEVLAALEIAQRFPRDERRSMDRIITACTRPSLAEKALYTYARGGTDISGPSIRLAETIAQCWGNMDHGFRELERRKGESSVESYAWDKETNTMARRAVQVPHVRDTRRGSTLLTDGRDVYELIANDAARRTRACILALIPRDVVDAAVAQVNQTLTASVKITPDLIEKLVTRFGSIGVPKEALEKNIQRRIETITPALVLRLRGIFNSINDGMSKPGDYFEIEPPAEGSRVVNLRENLKDEVQPVKPADDAPPPEPPADEEAARLSAMSGPDLTKHLKSEAKRLVVADQLEEIVALHGGWAKAKVNAAAIMTTIRQRAEAPIE